MKKTLILLALASLTATGAQAWGFLGHRVINQVAVYTLPAGMQPFYYRHLAEIVRQSTAPDERRNDDPAEGPKHYIDMDHYAAENPFAKLPQQYDKAVEKYSADTLKKYGTVPWVVLEMKDNLAEAFRQRDTVAIVKYSAELGHYVADAFVPLHTTINYDGQLTNQQGLHSLWESTLPERHLAEYPLTAEPASYVKDPLVAIWTIIQQSYGFLDQTFNRELKLEKQFPVATRYTYTHRYGKTQRRYSDAFADAYHTEVGGQVASRLKGAPTMVASMWLTAWQEAGKPDLNAMMHPPKLSKEEKEKLVTEQAAFKKNTLATDQLLLAQQKMKKQDAPDVIKAAEGAIPTAVPDPTPAADVPVPATPASGAQPADTKVKVKVKGKDGSEKAKEKPKK